MWWKGGSLQHSWYSWCKKMSGGGGQFCSFPERGDRAKMIAAIRSTTFSQRKINSIFEFICVLYFFSVGELGFLHDATVAQAGQGRSTIHLWKREGREIRVMESLPRSIFGHSLPLPSQIRIVARPTTTTKIFFLVWKGDKMSPNTADSKPRYSWKWIDGGHLFVP